ncbi:hypothetical protein ACLOJK_016419 [Asimina triloba]
MAMVTHEKSYEDFMLGHICINEFMFKARVELVYKFDVFKVRNVFDVAPIQLMPNSWKILRALSRLGEWMGHQINQTLWRVLLTRKQFGAWQIVTGKKSTKVMNNLSDSIKD